ncbi:MAG TPA: regulatory protein RecX [Candidatus Tectomicrobia bacterium]
MEPYRDPGMQAGTITALTVQRHQPTRVSVFLDGAFAFGIAQELVREWELGVGRCLRVEDQVRLRAADQLLAAQVAALHYLAARPRTVHEVWQKLRRSGVTDQVAEQVIVRLQARGALDDTAYVHAYLPSRLASRGYGPQRLRRELQQRGIGRALVEEAVQQDLAVEDVLAAARRQAAKRWPRLARGTDRVARRQKLWAFLCRRGFPTAIVQQVLTETMEDAAAAEEADPLTSSASRSDLSPSPRETG